MTFYDRALRDYLQPWMLGRP